MSPGFIDTHTHDDNLLLVDRDMTSKTSQGVTTVIAGNCGMSLAPLRPGRPVLPPFDLLGGPEDLGVKRVSIGGSLARATFGLIRRAAAEIRDHGTFTYAKEQVPDLERCRFFAARQPPPTS